MKDNSRKALCQLAWVVRAAAETRGVFFSLFPFDETDAAEKCTFGKPGSRESRKRRRKKEKALLRVEAEKFAKKRAAHPITTAPTPAPCIRETEDPEADERTTQGAKLCPDDLTLVDRLRACQSHWDKRCSKSAATTVQFNYDSAGRGMA